MSWALRRRLIILGSLAGLVALVLLLLYLVAFRAEPSCSDGKQNQDEVGVDCGGACAYLCSFTVAEPSVRFVRALTPSPGRTDVIAYIDNPNKDAGVNRAAYLIELYDAQNVVVGKKTGYVDLPPSATIPVFVPGFTSGNQIVARAFLTLIPESLNFETAYAEPTPPVSTGAVITESVPPRITAAIKNQSTAPRYNVPVVATVYDASGNVIAASQTVLSQIPAQGEAVAIFTWPEAFSAPAARADILPVLTLP